MSKQKMIRWQYDGRTFEFAYETIKKGEFSKVYLAQTEVVVKNAEGCYDKELLHFANQDGNYLNLPKVERLDSDSYYLYKMPRYAPITGNKTANAQRIKLGKIWDAVKGHNKYDRINDFNDAVQSSDLPESLKESIDSLISWIGNYGADSYGLEFPPRNVAQDLAGNLILLDVFFRR